MREHPEHSLFAHALARLLAGAPDPDVRDGERALRVMEQLPPDQRQVDGGETMAMVLAELGRFEEAAASQRQALAAAARTGQAGGGGRRGMAERLALYERRAPWRAEDPVQFGL